MTTFSATDAKNRIGDLWTLAEDEPVTIERNGIAQFQIISTNKYIAIPISEYDRLKSQRRAPRPGFAKDLFAGVDVDALLAVDIVQEIERLL